MSNQDKDLVNQVERLAKEMILACLKVQPGLPQVTPDNIVQDSYELDWWGRALPGEMVHVSADWEIYPENLRGGSSVSLYPECMLDESYETWTSGTVTITYPDQDGSEYEFRCQITEAGVSAKLEGVPT